ncbi:sensor histidine kinase [Mucilaginibacter calamicampi]|uniref:histidine kinase n=1 Tax=Mucilaginibacter calamicampi TaxID=1302352 RepID=A0ABW2Z220_9SPHI
MQKNIRYVIFGCAIALTLVLLLQFYWITKYYKVNQNDFEKEVNLAFEDALKKEFSLRCDTIQALIEQRLMDTTEFKISSEYSNRHQRLMYTISNAHNLKDKFISSSFSFNGISTPLLPGDTVLKRMIARKFAYNMRTEDLENHMVYYRTQNLGNFVDSSVKKYDFDTSRLRPVLNRYLAERNIRVPYKFYFRRQDSTLNRGFNSKQTTAYPIITKAYPTYTQKPGQQYVRAMFTNPFSYVVSRMGLIFAASLIIIGVVAFSLIGLMRMLIKEKRLSAIKNDFISNITHEFKTPIATASAAIEALTNFDVLKDADKTQRYLSHSKNELAKLSLLVDKVLSSSLYDSKQFDIKPENIDADDAIQKIMEQFAAQPGKTVSWTYNNNAGTSNIQADKLYFEHAINNVIDNAVKYAGNDVTINIQTHLKNNFWLLTITDNGIGIEANNLPLVFEKFYRVPSGNKHLVKGHGLGLSYVKNIIERHGGWCSIASMPGKGTTLTLAWPV